MATATTTRPGAVVLDASVVVAFCAKEPAGYPQAKAELERYAKDGWEFFAPGLLISEVLFVLCKKLALGTLDSVAHAQVVQSLVTIMQTVSPPPAGEGSLIQRAEQIRAGFSCKHSADGIYLALAEELATTGTAELLTFDEDMEKQAKKNAPGVTVKRLT